MKNFVKAINSPLSKDFQQEYDIALVTENEIPIHAHWFLKLTRV